MTREVVQVDTLLDGQPLRASNLFTLLALLLALISDGFDLQLLSFAAPGLVRDWGIARASLAPVFSANLFGMVVGATLLGALGDRIGRKRVIVLGTLCYGLASLGCLAATDLWQLGALRFVTGIGLGGVLPNVIALMAESVPRAWRAVFTCLVVAGMHIGSTLPAIVAAKLVPEYGWSALFVVGGIAPLAIAAVLALAIPESLLFLTSSGRNRRELERRVAALAPHLDVNAQTNFVLRPANLVHERGMKPLFTGRFAVNTPFLWLMFASSLLAMYLVTSWLPLLLEDAGLPAPRAAALNAYLHLGAAACSLVTAAVLGRAGLGWIMVLVSIAGAACLTLAVGGLQPGILGVAIFSAGFGILGTQTALNASAGLIYPASIRPTGVGAALGIGRIGSIAGPLVGGALIASGLSTQHFFFAPLVPLALVALATLALIARRVDIRTSAQP